MVKLEKENYGRVHAFAQEIDCEREYPSSLIELRQAGDILVDNALSPRAVLFWHGCGFTHIAGAPDAAFLAKAADLVRGRVGQRRCVLLSERPDIASFFAAEKGIERLGFLSFRHTGAVPSPRADVTVSRIDKALLKNIDGRIIPTFSWENTADFLKNGFGYAAVIDGEVAAWSFSSAIGAGIVDIGVETRESFRGHGYATEAAAAMVRACCAAGLTPSWCCGEKNIASAAVARKLGFTLHKSLSFFRAVQE